MIKPAVAKPKTLSDLAGTEFDILLEAAQKFGLKPVYAQYSYDRTGPDSTHGKFNWAIGKMPKGASFAGSAGDIVLQYYPCFVVRECVAYRISVYFGRGFYGLVYAVKDDE